MTVPEVTKKFREFLVQEIELLDSYTISPEVAKQKHVDYSVCVIQETMAKSILIKFDELVTI